MTKSSAKNIVAITLAVTVCVVLITSVIASLFYPPGSVSEIFRIKIFDLLVYIVGVVSGWLLGRGDPTPPASGDKPPAVPPAEKSH